MSGGTYIYGQLLELADRIEASAEPPDPNAYYGGEPPPESERRPHLRRVLATHLRQLHEAIRHLDMWDSADSADPKMWTDAVEDVLGITPAACPHCHRIRGHPHVVPCPHCRDREEWMRANKGRF